MLHPSYTVREIGLRLKISLMSGFWRSRPCLAHRHRGHGILLQDRQDHSCRDQFNFQPLLMWLDVKRGSYIWSSHGCKMSHGYLFYTIPYTIHNSFYLYYELVTLYTWQHILHILHSVLTWLKYITWLAPTYHTLVLVPRMRKIESFLYAKHPTRYYYCVCYC